MRILALSDLHGSQLALDNLPKWTTSLKPDIILLSGDITHKNKPANYLQSLAQSLPHKVLVVAIPGNCDYPKQLEKDCQEVEFTYLHGRKMHCQDIPIIGLGGSLPHFLGGPFQMSESEMGEIVEPLMEPNSLLMIHNPPHRILDRVRLFGIRAGSKELRKIAEKHRPRLVISGHVHEARGIERWGETIYVNPGPAKKGNGALITWGEKIELELLTNP